MFNFISLLPIVILLSSGYFSKKVKIIKQKQAKTLLDFAINFALPCLIFKKIYYLTLDYSLIILILIGLLSCVISALFAIAIGKIFNFSKATLASMFLLSCFGNTIVIGMPIIESVLSDPKFVGEVILYDAIATTLPASIFGPFILSFGNDKKISLTNEIKKIASFPPFLALFLGFICKPFVLPSFIFSSLDLFGNSAIPIALFALGLKLKFSEINTSFKPTIIVIVSKMILAPLILILFLKFFNFELKNSAIMAIIESATPTMTLASIMIIKAGLDSRLAINTIAFGILFAFISIPILLQLIL
ncbi:AEC family transporter [Campylobacter jejuni]|nr:AEC family transporter [Campylobacter jejuni]EKT0454280.1 AEC family transporter [Campylobacter jejuni]